MAKVKWSRKKKEGGISNEDRAEWGQAAVEGYMSLKGDMADVTDDNANLADLMTDLMHFAASEGHDPEAIVRTAQMHFEAER